MKYKGIIEIYNKQWLDKINGNTYNKTTIVLNDKVLKEIPFYYGYGNHFEYKALEVLKEHIKGIDKTSLWQLRELGYKIIICNKENCLKRDLL